ncbi:histone-fold-containing protein [Infundibulicybe gibba]|nr:histone-fold-containing protein [Infundibulicybe gibba]
MPRKTDNMGPISAQAQQDLVSEGIENFELPKSIVTKIAKSAIPDNAKLQKETVLSLVKGSTVFINYLGVAHDVALSKQHKSISASDVLKALEMIEFGDLVDKLQDELLVYREHTRTDKTKKVSAGPSNAGSVRIRPPAAQSAPRGREMGTIVPNGDAQGAYAVVPVGGSISADPAGVPMDVDEEMIDEEGEGEGRADETEGEVEGVDDVDEDEDEGVTEDEMPDPMAVEVEGLRVDQMGLEVPAAAVEPAE